MDIELALQRFGLTSFRPGQREVIEHIVAGNDCLCVMPTGGGKSLCFQLPTVVRPGLTIVVSPLIALMKDQVDALHRRGISATLINSTLSTSEQNERLVEVADGKYSMVYVAPERLRNSRFLEVIRATPVQLLAIDEAHCISEWGHDFRPDYARLGQFREALGGVQTIALTATATLRVRQDICDVLGLKQPKHFVTGFARNNLYLGSVHCNSDRDKDRALFEFLKNEKGLGIIYAATRKRCEALVESIGKEVKISIGAYHAGLTLDQRRFIQDQFMTGKLQAIVATNAFGMGIDKADLRYVVHYNVPGSMEAYYQEAGRAGRDGLPSQCVVLYCSQDRFIQEFFIENANPPRELMELVYDGICELTEDPIERTSQEIREMLDVPQSAEAVGTSLQILARTGVIERLEMSGGLAMVRISSDLPTIIDMLPKDADVRRKVLRTVERAIGDRRHEAVYVHPRWLMQQTGMERDALNRSLNELKKLTVFEYVPPFRGRAIHFRRRGVPFDQLKIDFKALDERKRADFEKLDQVVAFAQSKRCRQLSILQYFGDPSATTCGLCDRCQGYAGWPKIPTAEGKSDSVEPQIKAAEHEAENSKGTSCSYQTTSLLLKIIQSIDELHGRLGKLLIVDFLCGSESAKVQRLRLSRLRGYGMLASVRKKSVVAMMDIMLTAGILEQHSATANRPTVSVSELGRLVAAAQKPIPNEVAALANKLISEVDSSKRGVDSPKIIESIATKPPSSLITPIIPIIPVSPATPTLTTAPTLPLAPKVEARLSKPMDDWHWTIKLVSGGFELTEIAAIRRKSVDEIIEDLTQAARSGTVFSTESLLDPAIQNAIYQVRLDPPAAIEQPIFRERPALLRLAQALRG
ncbi:MAG: RecQ family ATP-dependent DNA helicase [Pirellulaceae bacterium]|nr:RecQ family ATP-dependent DNA helicase [Pirellulaceae bacterium]